MADDTYGDRLSRPGGGQGLAGRGVTPRRGGWVAGGLQSTVAELVAKYDGRAPRYTSYPTAVQFTPEVDEAVYRGWLRRLPTDEAVALYVHVPFCHRLCWYCGCNTRAVTRHGPIADYVELLTDELALLQAALPARLRLGAVHLGGGTPNLLTPADMQGLFGAIETVFAPGPQPELAAELDPTSLTEAWVAAAAGHGLRRASLGVQVLDPAVQAAVNRVESFAQVARAVGWLRAAGVRSINLDLMYGLPRQTTANTLETIEAVLPLRPDRIALFGYAHVPWMKVHQRLIDEAALPGPAGRLEQAEAAAQRLVAAGYVRIGLDHFARPGDDLAIALGQGRLRRNFQGYTADPPGTLLGVGASAIGALPDGFVQNITPEVGWRAAVAAGRLPVARGVAASAEDRFRGELIERLMCDLSVDLAQVCLRHGRDPAELDEGLRRLAPAFEDGLVRLEGARLSVRGAGRLVVRSICSAFDQHFAPEAGRHSRAL
jgi:oxygen-independent coproporphyrinogen-3 oxidase